MYNSASFTISEIFSIILIMPYSNLGIGILNINNLLGN